MGKLSVHIEHGSDVLNAKTLVIGGGLLLTAASGASGAVISGLTGLLEWVAGVMAVVIAVASVLVVRKIRATRHTDYVESIHGPSERNILIDLEAEKRRELARIRSIRHDIERERVIRAVFERDYSEPLPPLEPEAADPP